MGYKGYISEILKFPNRNKDIGPIAALILGYFLKNPYTSTYQIYTYLKPTEHSMAYKNVFRRVQRLHSLNLIEKVKKIESQHAAIYYRLTTGGIFYLLYKRQYKPVSETLKKFFKNYSDNIIFKTFVYPYFEHRTILQLNVFYTQQISDYLYHCCKFTEHDELDLDKEESIIYENVFEWDKVSERITELGSLLRRKLNLGWLKEPANVQSMDEGNSLRISSGKNFLYIKLNKEKTKAVLTTDDKQRYEFKIDKISSERLEILAPYMTREEYGADYIEKQIELRLSALAFSVTRLSLQFGKHARESISYLLEDEKFIHLLTRIENRFREDYQEFMQLRNKK